MIAALFVADDGPYIGLSGVDAWTAERDARKYSGPYPVVAHPPCERWGRYWSGGTNPKAKRQRLGDDGGCFAAALAAVRKWGGVLEHPANSHAWAFFELTRPSKKGGWIPADSMGGFTCHVEQGHYGHLARKATWLYAAKVLELPELHWGPSGTEKAPYVYAGDVSRSTLSNMRAKARGLRACEFLSRRQRTLTPIAFRDLLIQIASPA